jgi:hypothetical protein
MEVPGSSSIPTLQEFILVNVVPAKCLAVVAERSLR